MSKLSRFTRTLVLALCMTLVSAAALAAAPKLTLSVPSKEVRGGADYTITLTPTEPGFATVYLYQNGKLVSTIAKNKEIHTKANELTATGFDDAGEYILPGTYTVTAVMVDQFGASSAEVSKDLTFKLPRDSKLVNGKIVFVATDEATTTATTTTTTTTASASSVSSALKGAASSTSTKTAAPKATATPKPAEIVTYKAGTAKVGAEGYEIGVGVSDAAKTAKGYWSLTSSSPDADVWAAMQQPMIAVNVGENENAYIYDSVNEGRKRLGTVSGTSQGLNVITEIGKWSLVEAFRIEDGAFVRGYIRTDKLRVVEPNPTYGIVIDKKTQTLIVYKDGARIGSTPVSTGLPTVKYLHRETPAGEYITVTRRGTIEYYGNGFSKYTIRVGGSYHLSEIPTTKKGGSDYSMLEGSLGQKATRGNIVIGRTASTDGSINAEWIWNLTDENKRVRVFIFDDKDRSSVPVGSK